jgi:lipoprotein-anchoring transpeptidase ErfK/SrfK
VFKTKIGVGQAVTPTPTGEYYITELLEQPDPTGTYGPFAFGLSAHSDVLNEFAGRDGVLGVHGTNFPQGIGTDVSHGCIRMSNDAITKLAGFLPVGTPVQITRDQVTSA